MRNISYYFNIWKMLELMDEMFNTGINFYFILSPEKCVRFVVVIDAYLPDFRGKLF